MRMQLRIRRWATPALVTLLLLLLAPPALGATVLQGDLRQALGEVHVPADTVLQGNVNVASGTARIDGRVEGDVEVANGRAVINGSVTGHVKVVSGEAVLGPGARVDGRVAVVRGQVERDPAAQVAGGVTVGVGATGGRPGTGSDGIIIGEGGIYGPGIAIDEHGVRLPGIHIGADGVRLPGLTIGEDGVRFGDGTFAVPRFGWHTVWVNPLFQLLRWAGLFALAAVTVAVMPVPLGRMAQELEARPVQLGLNGLLILVLIPIALMLLILTIIGIPLALLAVPALAVAKFIGYVAVSLWLGERLSTLVHALQGNHGKVFVRLLVGTLVLAIAGQVPILGWLVGLAGAALGFGVVWATRFGTGGPWFRGPTNPTAA